MLEHYHKTEHSFVLRVMDQKRKIEDNNENILTKFLSPREVDIYKEIFGKDYTILEEGGYVGCERKRVLVQNNKQKRVDFDIACLKITYNKKFGELNHKQIFGALMKLGIERDNFGDIYVDEENTYLFLCDEMKQYVIDNIGKIGKQRIFMELVDYKELNLVYQEKMSERLYFLKSLRLDLLVAHVCIYARTEAEEMIKQGLVKVNHRIIEKDSHQLEVGDVVSVRGYGRLKILENQGETKNERLRILIGRVI